MQIIVYFFFFASHNIAPYVLLLHANNQNISISIITVSLEFAVFRLCATQNAKKAVPLYETVCYIDLVILRFLKAFSFHSNIQIMFRLVELLWTQQHLQKLSDEGFLLPEQFLTQHINITHH